MKVTENGIHRLEGIEPVVEGHFEATATEELDPPGLLGTSSAMTDRAVSVSPSARTWPRS